MVVHLWIREDGEEPKAIEAGATPPGPGLVVAVSVPSSGGATKEARRLYEASLRPLPSVDPRDPEPMLAARAEVEAAQMRVQKIGRFELIEKGGRKAVRKVGS